MSKEQAFAIWKAIMRHHPFFQSGGMFGFDWRTFHVCYPADCAILRECVRLAETEAN